jgi:hypothetical protein
MKHLSRRDVFELAAGVAALPFAADAQTPAAPVNTLRYFPGFASKRVKTSGRRSTCSTMPPTCRRKSRARC